MQAPIILIGPMCAGKSTIAQCLAERLCMPRCQLDDIRWDYYAEIGYDPAQAAQIAQSEGFVGIAHYWKPFEAHAVERVLADSPNSIIDFGAGHSVYDDSALFIRVQRALAPYRMVILLLPSPNLDESVALLNKRLTLLLEREVGAVDPTALQMNEYFVKHPSNHRLATRVVYTKEKTPEQTCNEIVQMHRSD